MPIKDNLEILGLTIKWVHRNDEHDWFKFTDRKFLTPELLVIDSYSVESEAPTTIAYGETSENTDYYNFPVARTGKFPTITTVRKEKTFAYLEKFINKVNSFISELESKNIMVPRFAGKYLFYFTPEETEQLILAGVPAEKAIYCRVNLKEADLTQIIDYAHIPYEWLELMDREVA